MIYHRPKEYYIWQQPDWPHFKWNQETVIPRLISVKSHASRLLGILSTLGFERLTHTSLDSITRDIIDSSQIEGEILNAHSVRSSIARRLGIPVNEEKPTDHHTEGIVQVALDAQQHYQQPVTAQRLFGWHAALFPTGYSGTNRITVAGWRQGDDPMLIVSGAVGHEEIHYEAPPSAQVASEMHRFLHWLEHDTSTDPLLHTAIAHLWFVAIHPFDDGNGRIARTLTDLLLCRSDDSAYRCYSVNAELLRHRNEYYNILQCTTCGDTDITTWVLWFLDRIDDSLQLSEKKVTQALQKRQLFNHIDPSLLNNRQRKMIDLLLGDFEGTLTTSKWAKITHCSPDTALRDINNLIDMNILAKAPERGRSSHYILSTVQGS